MALRAGPPTFARSPHLVTLVAEVERLAGAIGRAPADARATAADQLGAEARAATLALDGAEVAGLPGLDAAQAVVAASGQLDGDVEAADSSPREAPRRGTWLDAMRAIDDPPDELVQALEVLGVAAADAADDLQEALLTEPADTLAELHRRLTRGLVARTRAGQPRISDQAVHDASTGRIVYFTAEPEAVPGELALLDAWMVSAGAREHGLITSGVLHLELLRIHPFDAANGRLARAAARLVLRARGLDPDHLAVAEPALALDPLGYAEEVARTRRRRDLTIWLERWGDAVVDGLRRSARSLGVLDAADEQLGEGAIEFATSTSRFTITDHRAARGLGAEDARSELGRLLDAGLIRRVVGSRGLRFERAASEAG